MSVAIAAKTVLVTGANRGLGRALADEALRRGAKRVYAAARQPILVPDDRVTPVTLDVTDPAKIQEVADRRAGVAKQLERQNAAMVQAEPIAA